LSDEEPTLQEEITGIPDSQAIQIIALHVQEIERALNAIHREVKTKADV